MGKSLKIGEIRYILSFSVDENALFDTEDFGSVYCRWCFVILNKKIENWVVNPDDFRNSLDFDFVGPRADDNAFTDIDVVGSVYSRLCVAIFELHNLNWIWKDLTILEIR